MQHTAPVPLIEVIGSKGPFDNAEGRVKFKGKMLDPKIAETCGDDYAEIKMTPRILFDFTAKELPDILYLVALIADDTCLGLLQYVSLYREKKYVEMRFSFAIEPENPPKSDLNPFVTLAALTKALKKEKYKLRNYAETFGHSVSFRIPFRDNVYSHYKTHLAALEKLCRPIENEVIKRLNKNLKNS